MDKEQIIQMARDAGFHVDESPYHWDSSTLTSYPKLGQFASSSALERFAAAIRAATKEEDAKICENMANEKEATPEQEFALDLASDAIRASK